MGLKTTYYLRTLGASQVEKSTVDTQSHGSTHERKSFTVGAAPEAKTTPVPPVSMSSSEVDPATGIKLCKINDPTCESCQ